MSTEHIDEHLIRLGYEFTRPEADSWELDERDAVRLLHSFEVVLGHMGEGFPVQVGKFLPGRIRIRPLAEQGGQAGLLHMLQMAELNEARSE